MSTEDGEVDLSRQAETEEKIAAHNPQAVILAAARVAGIHAMETQPADFLYENPAIEANEIHGAWKAKVERAEVLKVWGRARPAMGSFMSTTWQTRLSF